MCVGIMLESRVCEGFNCFLHGNIQHRNPSMMKPVFNSTMESVMHIYSAQYSGGNNYLIPC